MKDMDYAVEITNLTIEVAREITAIKDISAKIPIGKITGFIGPSGAGKTTLIRALVGRQRITSGSVTVLSQPAGSQQLRKAVRYMTQALSVYADLTVSENLCYFARMTGVSRKQVRLATEAALRSVSMTDHKDSLVDVLSGGQKQRVSLAIALIDKPNILILDEPTVGLDPVLREELWDLFRSLAKAGVTIILSSHVMDEASRCDELLLIRDGIVIAHGTPDRLCERTGSATVEQAFVALVGAGV